SKSERAHLGRGIVSEASTIGGQVLPCGVVVEDHRARGDAGFGALGETKAHLIQARALSETLVDGMADYDRRLGIDVIDHDRRGKGRVRIKDDRGLVPNLGAVGQTAVGSDDVVHETFAAMTGVVDGQKARIKSVWHLARERVKRAESGGQNSGLDI